MCARARIIYEDNGNDGDGNGSNHHDCGDSLMRLMSSTRDSFGDDCGVCETVILSFQVW